MTAPYKRLIVLDFETRWASKTCEWAPDGYTLSKMTTEAYIRDPKFHAFGLCFKDVGDSGKAAWVSHADIPAWVASINWSETAVLAHNAQFDVSILSFIYGAVPCFVFDSLSMGRALRGVEVGNSLAKLAEDYGLPPKGKAVHSTDGLWEIPAVVEQELADYCAHDVFLCESVFGNLLLRINPETRESKGRYPTKELQLIDMTLRMYIDPVLVLDKAMLEKALGAEERRLNEVLTRVGLTAKELGKNDVFGNVLRSLGVEPPTKKSPTTGLQIPAYAKKDALFQELLNSDNEDIALLCDARLKVKSALERTRAQRFIDIASRGTLPVPLSYYGASQTGRWAAAKGSNINMQNMKRGSFLRDAIMAPDGYLLGVADLSQIEPRVLGWLSDYVELLDIFRGGADPYATFGAQMFNIPGMTKESHPVLRQSAKSGMLGCGFQLGWASFAAQLLVGFLGADPKRYTKEEAKQLGVTKQMVADFLSYAPHVEAMNEIPHSCTEEELLIHCLAAKAIIDKYRATAAPVVQFWDLLGELIQHSLIGGKEYDHKGVLLFRKEEIVMANGMSIRYPKLTGVPDKKGRLQYQFFDGKKWQKLYPGRICNNVTQGTARIIMSDGLLRINKYRRVLGTVHDEGIVLLPEESAQSDYPWMLRQMTKVPSYMPGIPLAADGGVHKRYGKAKV